MEKQDKRLIELLGEEIDPFLKEKYLNPKPQQIIHEDGTIEIVKSVAPGKLGPVVPSYAKNRPKLYRFSTMQQLEIMKARCNDKMFVLFFWAKWYPECDQIKKRMAALSQ